MHHTAAAAAASTNVHLNKIVQKQLPIVQEIKKKQPQTNNVRTYTTNQYDKYMMTMRNTTCFQFLFFSSLRK